MKILFFIGSLHMGGVERGVAKISSYWAAKGFDVAVLTLTSTEGDFYPLHPHVKRLTLDLMEPRETLFEKIILQTKRMFALPKVIKTYNPDIVLSFATDCNLLSLQTAWMHSVPVIISERNNADKKIIKKTTAFMRRALYPFARKIVFVSEGVARSFPWVKDTQKTVILNALEEQELHPAQRQKTIVSTGRLVEAKGYDILIGAFSKITDKYDDWTLEIYGEGPLRQTLQQQIDAAGLSKKITLMGFTKEPALILQTCGIFVLSSRYEGLPNALMEAMSVGAPCVSFDCPSGPSELITDHHDGVLVAAEDETGLSTAIAFMIENPDAREKMGNNALAINKRLHINTITAQWQALIRDVIKQ